MLSSHQTCVDESAHLDHFRLKKLGTLLDPRICSVRSAENVSAGRIICLDISFFTPEISDGIVNSAKGGLDRKISTMSM